MAQRKIDKDYELIVPLDYVILDRLMDEGTMMGGIAPLGTAVSELRKRKPLDILTPEEVSARLRNMNTQGLAIKVRTSGNKRFVWQRSAEGLRMLTEYLEAHGEEAKAWRP